MADQDGMILQLQLALDASKGVAQVHEIADAAKKAFGQGVDLDVNVNVNAGNAPQQIDRLTKEMQDLTAAVSESKKEMDALAKTAQEKAKALETVMKGAADKIGKSFSEGAGKAEEALKSLIETAQKPMGKSLLGEQAKVAELAVKKMREVVREIRALKEEDARATSTLAHTSIQSDIRAAEAKLLTFKQNLRKAFPKVAGSSAPSGAAEAQAYYEAERAVREAQQRTKQLEAQLHHARSSAPPPPPPGGRRPTSTGGMGGEPWRFNIDVPHLITQIEKAFIPTYKLNLDMEHIQAQLGGLRVGAEMAAVSPAAAAAGPGGRINDAVRRRNVAIRQKTREELLAGAYQYITQGVPGSAQYLDTLQGLTGPNVNRAAMNPDQLKAHRQQGEAALYALHQAVRQSGLDPAQAQEVAVYLNQQYGSPFRRVGAAINQRGMNANERISRTRADFLSRGQTYNELSQRFFAGDEKARGPLQEVIGPYLRSTNAMIGGGLGSLENLTTLKANLKALQDQLEFRRKMTGYEKEVAAEHSARMKQQAADDKKYYKEVADAHMRLIREEAAEEKRFEQESARYWMARMKAEGRIGGGGGRGVSGAGFGQTLRSMLALVGGVGIGYSAYNMIGNGMRTQMEYGQQIANLQGVLGSRNPLDAAALSSGIGSVAAKYGMDLVDAAKAAQMFVRADKDAAEVVKDLDHAMAASKALGLTIEQVQELQVAVKEVTADNDKYNQSIDYTGVVLDKISAVQSHYAVGADDMAQAIKILTPLIDNFTNGLGGMNDTFDYTIALTTVVAEKLRITGVQAANSLKLLFSRITTPQTLNKLQQTYGVKVGNSETGDYLPVDRLIGELGHTYSTLAPDKQKQFVEQLGGSRNINSVTALLESYAQVQEVASKSSDSFGDSQKRAAIGMDTLQSRVGQLKTGFNLFIKESLDATHVADGLKATIAGLAGVFGGVGNATGAGGLGGSIALTLGIGLAVNVLKKLYIALKESAAAAALTESAASGLLGELAAIFTPGGLIIAGALAMVGIVGALYSHFQKAREEAERYKVTLRDITGAGADPQFQVFKDTASRVGLGSAPSAFRTISGVLGGANAGAFSSLEADLQRYSKMSDKEFQKFYTEHPEALRHFQQEFTKIFVSQLPKDVQEAFGSMKTEGEKIDAVMKIVAGTASAATLQLKGAIEDLGAATQRVMDDSLQKLKELEEARKNPGLLTSLSNAFFGDNNLYKKIPIEGGGSDKFLREFLVGQLKGMTGDIPLYKALLGDTTLANYGAGAALTPERLTQIRAGKGGSYASVMNDLMASVQANPEMNNRLNLAILRQTGDWKSLAHMSDVDLRKMGATDEDLEHARAARMSATAQAGAMNVATQYLRNNNPDRARAGDINRVLNRAGSGGTATALAVPINGANEALVHFKDVLLDTARQIYEAVRRFNFEQSYSRRFGQAYDLGGAQVQLGRTFLNMADDFDTSHTFDIVGLRRQISHLDSVSTVDPKTGKRIAKTGVKQTELEKQIGELQQEIVDFGHADLTQIFGNSKEGQELATRFRSALKKAGLGDYSEMNGFSQYLRTAGAGLTYTGIGNQYSNSSSFQSAGLRQLVAGHEGQLALAEVGNDDPLRKRLTAQSEAAQKQYEAAAEELAVRRALDNMSANDYKLAKDKLDAEYQINQIFQDRLSITQEQQKYDDQARANLGEMLSGFRRTLTDTSIWEGVAFPKSTDVHRRWKESATAIRNILFDTITPVFKTLNDRIVQNIFQKLVYSLSEMGPLKDLVNTGEFVLKSNIQGAQIHYAMMMDAFNKGSAITYQAIVAAMSGQPMPGPGSTTPPAPGGGGAPGTPSGTSKIGMAAIGAGIMIGQIGGTLVGKGGPHAQQGAAIGSSIGTLVGMIGGPIGMGIGGMLGGVLGGFLGGKHDDHQRANEDPIVKGLDAIERAQRDTISTINAQTDALLKPENRFLNLPSNFNVPEYSAGGFGSGGTLKVSVDVNVNGSVPAETHQPIASAIAQKVRDGLGEMLYNQRRNQSRA